MKISDHFTLAEMCATSTGLPNNPTPAVQANITKLCRNVLEPARIMTGEPLIITSGYRSRAVNIKVGGATNSYHLTGLAADIRVRSEQYAQTLLDIFALNTHVDLALYEHSKTAKWIHVQTSDKPRHIINRNFNV